MPNFCPECHLTVAPQEPGRQYYGDFVFHGACLIRWLLKHMHIAPPMQPSA